MDCICISKPQYLLIMNQIPIRSMHCLNKTKYFVWASNLSPFPSYTYTLQYQSSVYRYQAPMKDNIMQNGDNNEIGFLKSILTRYDIKMPQQTKNDKHLAQALKKISKFKGDMRLSYKHQLNKLITQLDNNLSVISLNDKMKIFRSLSENLECNTINKKLMDQLSGQVGQFNLYQLIQLLESTLRYKKIHHCPQKVFSRQNGFYQRIISKIQQTISRSNIQIINTNKDYREMLQTSQSVSKFAVPSYHISILTELIKNQGKSLSIIYLLIDKVLMKNMKDFNMPALLNLLTCLYAPLNAYQFLKEEEWMIVLEHIQSRSQEIKSINKYNLLNNAFLMYAKLKLKRERNQRGCETLLIMVEKLIEMQQIMELKPNFKTISILNKLLIILKHEKNQPILNRTHDLFFQYLYVTIKDIKIHQYNGRMLLLILTRIKVYKQKYMFKERNREVNNIVTAVSQQLWNKCDDIFQSDDIKFKQELYKLIQEKDVQYNREEVHKRKGYFILNLPEQIQNKISNFYQEIFQNDEEKDDVSNDDDIY